jgi:hypothetical protein
MELLEIKNEVMRKIGRNVLLYQQVEHILKYLVSNGRISGDVSTMKSRHESRKSSVAKKTMGTVAGDFFNEIFAEEDSFDSLPENPSAVHLSISFRIETEEKHFELRRDAIASLVADRNELIHHLIPKLNTESIDGWLETDRDLDLQREKILPELEYLQTVAKQFSDMRKDLGEYLLSAEGKKQFPGLTDEDEGLAEG